MKVDVLLLADIIESFRDMCLKDYGLDPAYYISASNFSWDACLKYTGIELELITEEQQDMYLLFEMAKRGGISQVGLKRYAKSDKSAIEICESYLKGEEVPAYCKKAVKKVSIIC